MSAQSDALLVAVARQRRLASRKLAADAALARAQESAAKANADYKAACREVDVLQAEMDYSGIKDALKG